MKIFSSLCLVVCLSVWGCGPIIIPHQSKKCKDDCDCVSQKQACHEGTCQSINRVNTCPKCDGNCKKGESCQKPDGTIGTCPEQKLPCKHDCDCVAAGKVCHEGTCQPLKRANLCLKCDGNCKKGDPCQKKDGSIGTCPEQKLSCKHDCDCVAAGKVCQGGFCSDIERASFCLKCDGNCKKGDPCQKKDGSIGTCQQKSCKDDCDCVAAGKVCEQGTCLLINRRNNCPLCNGSCKPGDPCQKSDGSLGTCQQKTCKHDCDCVAAGLVCHEGTCQPLKRANLCQPCNGPCKPGDPCMKTDGSLGTCQQVSCKHDCDCIKWQLVCHQGTCQPINRPSLCVSCSGACQAGDPCRKSDGTIGVCSSSTFACGNKQCQKGKEYCSETTPGVCGGTPVPPSGCPAHCSATTCPDGKDYCLCKSYQCHSLPTGCNQCSCLKNTACGPAGSCREKKGNLWVYCAMP